MCLGTTGQTQTWVNYIAKTQADVEAHLLANFVPETGIDINTRGLFILDIEGSADGHSTHPSDLYLESAADQALVIESWRLRARAVRAVFPNCTIGQYGTPVPNPRGNPDNIVWLDRIAGLVAAGVAGAYDDLDYLSPLIYARFGPHDTANEWGSYAAMTLQAVEGARQMRKSDGSQLPVMPLLNTNVDGANSLDNNVMLFDLAVDNPLKRTVGIQVEQLKQMGETDVCLWVGAGNTQLINSEENVGRNYTVNQHTQQILDIDPLYP